MPQTLFNDTDPLHALLKARKTEGAAILYDRYAATLHKIIFCSISDRALTDEILIETYQAAWAQLADFFKGDQHLLLWLSGIARKQTKARNISHDLYMDIN